MAKARTVPFIDPDASLFVHAAVSIGTRLDELIAYEPFLADANAVYELHQMRIAAKRLRYTMDLFQSAYNDFSLYGKDFAAVVTEVKLLQEHLGNIHDADVLAPKLALQLRKMLSLAHGKDKHGEELVGVHLVDFDACQGLLSLCTATRTDRDASFERLQQDWRRMGEDGLFDHCRKLLRKAITDETLAAVLHENLPSTKAGDDKSEVSIKEDLAPRQNASGAEQDRVVETKMQSRDMNEAAATAPETEPHIEKTNGDTVTAGRTTHRAAGHHGDEADEKPRDEGESRNGKTTRAPARRKRTSRDA